MAAEVTQRSNNQTYVAYRTQALPKSSLFGTSLEITDGQSSGIEDKPISPPRELTLAEKTLNKRLGHCCQTMAAEVTQRSNNQTYVAYRTQALPKSSLFGTSLEITDGQSSGIEDKPISPPRELTLADKVIRHKRREWEQQKTVVKQKREALQSVEDKALTFNPDPNTTVADDKKLTSRRQASRRQQIDKTHQWFTMKDLDHQEDINTGGLSGSRNFNRDKYGRRAPVHQYSQMGHILQPGQEFTSSATLDVNQNSNGDRQKLQTTITNRAPARISNREPPPRSVIDLPANIRHMFGSKVCDELLSDEGKVADTIARHERVRFPPRRNRRSKTPEFEKNESAEYSGLSNATRQNVFPGYTTSNKTSTTKTVYNDSVYTERYPDPDEFRYQRDELSKWAEHNVLRERMKKAWDLKAESSEKKN